MMYLDLGELEHVFRGRWLWSTCNLAIARFRRDDHMGNPHQPLDEAVRDLVAESGRKRPTGPIRLLTHLRYFGYVFNPVSFYFCFDNHDHIDTVVAEVNNTPWGEQHCYVLDVNQLRDEPGKDVNKEFHVSPFMAMDATYRWEVCQPGKDVTVGIENFHESKKFFDVRLTMKRREITTANLARMFFAYPLMTQHVTAAIYWQAVRLWMKGCPFFSHPRKAAGVALRTTVPPSKAAEQSTPV